MNSCKDCRFSRYNAALRHYTCNGWRLPDLRGCKRLLLEKQLAEARAEIERLNKNLRLLLCKTHFDKCEAGLFNSKNPDDEPCLICLMGAAERGE